MLGICLVMKNKRKCWIAEHVFLSYFHCVIWAPASYFCYPTTVLVCFVVWWRVELYGRHLTWCFFPLQCLKPWNLTGFCHCHFLVKFCIWLVLFICRINTKYIIFVWSGCMMRHCLRGRWCLISISLGENNCARTI
jgi:hypothetical protein